MAKLLIDGKVDPGAEDAHASVSECKVGAAGMEATESSND